MVCIILVQNHFQHFFAIVSCETNTTFVDLVKDSGKTDRKTPQNLVIMG